jgi:hypothetical protein
MFCSCDDGRLCDQCWDRMVDWVNDEVSRREKGEK